MLKHISLSDVVVSRVFVSFRFGFRFTIGFRLVVVHVVGFDPRSGPARPGPARAPLAPPALPMRAPPSPWSLSLIWFLQHSNLPISLPPLSLSPRGALGFGNGDRRSLDPRGEFPLPFPLSLSLPPPPFLIPQPARPPWPRAPSPAPASPNLPGGLPRRSPSPRTLPGRWEHLEGGWIGDPVTLQKLKPQNLVNC
jgi:hypothetical protein